MFTFKKLVLAIHIILYKEKEIYIQCKVDSSSIWVFVLYVLSLFKREKELKKTLMWIKNVLFKNKMSILMGFNCSVVSKMSIRLTSSLGKAVYCRCTKHLKTHILYQLRVFTETAELIRLTWIQSLISVQQVCVHVNYCYETHGNLCHAPLRLHPNKMKLNHLFCVRLFVSLSSFIYRSVNFTHLN